MHTNVDASERYMHVTIIAGVQMGKNIEKWQSMVDSGALWPAQEASSQGVIAASRGSYENANSTIS